jgi:hypothetical protein
MHDPTDQLREWSKALAQAVEPADIERIKSPMTLTTTAKNNRRWLAVAASVVVIGVGIVAIATIGNGDASQISTATNPASTEVDTTTATTQPATSPTSEPDVVQVPQSTTPTTTDSPETTDPPTTTAAPTPVNPQDRLEAWPAAPAAPAPVNDIPRFLPTAPITAAGTPVRAQADGGSAAGPTFTQIFADADRDIVLTLQTQPNNIESTPAEFRQPLTISGWDDAFASDDSLRVVASDPSGFVRLTGTGIDNEQAAEIIASMQRRPDGLPGWNLSAGNAGLVEINGAWNDSAGSRFVTWFDGDRVVAQMLTSPAHTDLINQALAPAFDSVDVNGVDGWLNPNDFRRSIVWSPDGTNIVVLGVADARINPLDIAASVTELNATDFESRTTTEIPAGVGDGCDGSLFC